MGLTFLKRLTLISVALAALTACGGGDSAGAALTPSSPTALLNYAATTNIDSIGFPWTSVSPNYAGVVKRWSLTPLIPVKTNGIARATPALDAVEAKLGTKLFDRTSIESTPDVSITRGIVFSQGTAYLPSGGTPASYCANVSGAPFGGGYPPNFLKAPGEISTKLYVNLDNPQCTASAEIVIHELGHALGLGQHVSDFGVTASIGPDFWNLLATLYSNPTGTAKASVVFKQSN